ncbi:MAG: ptsH [Candidatus Paceibacter sp.]|jgi:phosphotransferase system HPr (HPr) family protein|nr:ptsH [Candidatus Paceibacter sp.]
MTATKACRTAEVRSPLGMHMRPWQQFHEIANKYLSTSIQVRVGEVTSDARSLMGLFVLCSPIGTKITIEADGEHAEEACTALKTFVESLFEI